MQYSTLTQVKTRLKNECDLHEDTFIDIDVELLGYINSAIDDCESIIHSLYEDYFLNKTTITLISDTSTYSAPSDIFAHKFRAILYNNPSGARYEIKKMKRLSETLFQTNNASTTSYKYLITNDSSSGVKLNFYPTPQEAGQLIDVWYIRNAKVLTSDSDSCDIPEFINFIYAHVKWHIAGKERSGINLASAEKEYLEQKGLLEKTLSDAVPTEDSTEIEKDMSFYQDFDEGTGIDVA